MVNMGISGEECGARSRVCSKPEELASKSLQGSDDLGHTELKIMRFRSNLPKGNVNNVEGVCA